MDTGKNEPIGQIYLLEELTRNQELAIKLRGRMWDIFVKEKEASPSESEAPLANPIDYAICISQFTQHILKGCLELLESEIIAKLIGR